MININSNNGSMLPGNKPLPELMFTDKQISRIFG